MNATGSVLLDTSVVVGYFRHDPDLHNTIDQVNDVYMPLVVLGDGAYKSTQKARMLAQVKAFSSGVFSFHQVKQLQNFMDRSKPSFRLLEIPFFKMTFG